MALTNDELDIFTEVTAEIEGDDINPFVSDPVIPGSSAVMDGEEWNDGQYEEEGFTVDQGTSDFASHNARVKMSDGSSVVIPELSDTKRSGSNQGVTPLAFGDVEDTIVTSKFEFKVLEPEKIGDGIQAYVQYKVTCRSSAEGWTKNEISVNRRYNEFLWLHDNLQAYEKCAIVPPLPEKVMTMSKFDPEFLQYRRRELSRFMKRVGAHKVLSTASALKTFMTAGELPRLTAAPPAEPAPASGSGSGWLSFIGNKVTSLASGMSDMFKPTEIDSWFESKAKYFDELEANILKLADNANKLVNIYRSKVIQMSEFYQICEAIAATEMGTAEGSSGDRRAATGFFRLRDIGSEMCMIDTEIADGVAMHWENELRDTYRYIGEVKVVLAHRLAKLGRYQGASSNVKAKQDKLEKLPVTNPDYDKARQEVVDAQKSEEDSRQEFVVVSEKVKREIEQFEATRIADVKNHIILFSQLHVNHTVREVDLWKRLLADI